jgi:ribosome-binding factor A
LKVLLLLKNNMSSFKEQKVEEILKQLAARYLQRESNRLSLITVTRVIISDKLRKATVLITVLPEEREQEALEFVRRQRTEFRESLKGKTRLQKLPIIDFDIDYGEKNRQRIDVLSAQ